MNEIIAALQDEISAAKRQRAKCQHAALYLPDSVASAVSTPLAELVRLKGYIQGLQTAVNLLEKEQARELPY